jgi:hypothetical protein
MSRRRKGGIVQHFLPESAASPGRRRTVTADDAGNWRKMPEQHRFPGKQLWQKRS